MLHIEPFFHSDTATFTYVVHRNKSKDAVILDPVADYQQANATLSYNSLADVLKYIQDNKLNVHWVIDTHCHADHVTAACPLSKALKTKSAIGQGFVLVRDHFAKLYDMEKTIGEQPYDLLVSDGQKLMAGIMPITAIAVPGHTKSCTAYLIDDALFCGDALFRPKAGCGRCDFPGGSASDLYDSITKNIYTLPESTRIFTGHDYPPESQEPQCETTVLESKESNVFIKSETTKENFVKRRDTKDKTLDNPKLLLAAMQVNILGGYPPCPHTNSQHYLKIPLTYKSLQIPTPNK